MRWQHDPHALGARDKECWDLFDHQGGLAGWAWSDGRWYTRGKYGGWSGRGADLAEAKVACEAACWAYVAGRLVGLL